MGGGPLRGREESGVVMGEKKKEGVYCVSGQGQRGLIMVWGGDGEEAIQDSEAISDSRKRPCKMSKYYYLWGKLYNRRGGPGIIYDNECRADSIWETWLAFVVTNFS